MKSPYRLSNYSWTLLLIIAGLCGLHLEASADSSSPADETFSMVIMSDPQFDWGCGSENTYSSDYCSQPANQSKSTEDQAAQTNELHVAAIKYIQNNLDSNNQVITPNFHFAGVIVNGDLTDFGSQNDDHIQYNNTYNGQGFHVWPGLGNHDYARGSGQPVDDCGFGPAWNSCAADMVQGQAGWIIASGALSNPRIMQDYDVTTYDENFAQAGNQKNVTGSLAYAWDIGEFHFVQLNNYPTYSVSFTRGYASGISSWDINVPSPESWLNRNLSAAISANPDVKIILNWHAETGTNSSALIQMLQPYASNIKAIFVGHIHFKFGKTNDLTFPAVTQTIDAANGAPEVPIRGEVKVPIIHSGSAIYNRFIRADFDTSNNGCKITTNVINSFTQPPSPTNGSAASGTANGAYHIYCGRYSAPPNDAFDDNDLLYFEPAVEGTLFGASNDGDSSAGTGDRQPDVWYKYRVTRDGMFRVDTCGSSALSGVNTTLSIHDGDTVAGTTANELVANDDWSEGGDEFAACADASDSAVALMVSDGDELLIRVSKYDSSTNGVFALNWSIGAAAVVTNGNDSGVGSLRYWLDLSPADSTITMSPIHGLFDIVLESPLNISKNVVIDGGGRSIIGDLSFRVITIAAGAEVALRSFTITDGSGGIENNGDALTLIDTNVTGNHADGGGGGVANKGGSLTVLESTIANNSAGGNGGGIENDGGVVTLIDSTIYQNSTTRYGGGIINFNGSLTLTNSTVSANNAVFSGGGIYNGNASTATTTSVNSTFSSNAANSNGGAISNYIGVVNLFHTTVVNNFALSGSGGGIYDNVGSVHIENTVVADNSATTGIGPDFRSFGTVIVDGANLIGINEGVEGWFDDELDPLVGSLNDRLPSGVSAFLEDNGGPTLTLISFLGSPVIDAAIATANSPVTDQRGVARPLGCASDLGALELEVADCDSDGDGLTDAMEITLGTDPDSFDSDSDGLVDGAGGVVTVSAYPAGIDGNGDGFVDGEVDFGTNPNSSNIGDVAPQGNPNDMIDLGDLYILSRMANGVIQPNVVDTALGDIDGDGDLDIADLLLLQQNLLNGSTP